MSQLETAKTDKARSTQKILPYLANLLSSQIYTRFTRSYSNLHCVSKTSTTFL